MKSKNFKVAVLSLLWVGVATANSQEPAAGWQEGGNTPRLEIRKYRFSHFGKGVERLVLEFERKDSNTSQKPTVSTEKSGTPREWNVQVGNAMLLGAIPDSLINEVYEKKSRLLGRISVNMDGNQNTFSVRTEVKGAHTVVKAQWLDHPARLVIDAHGSAAVAHRETLSVNHKTNHPGINDLMCFPSVAKVGLTVIFQQRHHAEDLQNIRVNTEGSASDAAPSSGAIVCYPKVAQVVAALSFEQQPTKNFLTKEAPVESAPATPSVVENEDDLDPGPLTMPAGLGQLPMTMGRAPAEAAAPAPAAAAPAMPAAPAGSPLSLLPPLNN